MGLWQSGATASGKCLEQYCLQEEQCFWCFKVSCIAYAVQEVTHCRLSGFITTHIKCLLISQTDKQLVIRFFLERLEMSKMEIFWPRSVNLYLFTFPLLESVKVDVAVLDSTCHSIWVHQFLGKAGWPCLCLTKWKSLSLTQQMLQRCTAV